MNTSKRIGSIALAFAMALGVASGPALAKDGKSLNERAPEALVGAWRVTVKPYRCDTGQLSPPQFWFPSFLTFAHGGTMLETGNSMNFQPGQRSVGHGYWERTGTGTYHAVIEAHVHFDTKIDPSAPPPPVTYTRGRQRLAQDIHMLDADSWTSLAEVNFYDINGNDLSSGCARAEGTRMW